MSLPLTDGDTTFERFLQALPADFHDLAIEFKAFSRGRKIKSPAQLLQVVMSYCGLDQALRETAGHFTLWQERISDTAIHDRLKACGPWVKALLSRLMGRAVEPLLAGQRRLVVVDGSTVQGPGAKGTWYRLHLAVDLVQLHLLYVKVTDVHEGECLTHYPLQAGDVVLADRGYNRAPAWRACAEQGVDLVVRYKPQSVTLLDPSGVKINWWTELQATAASMRCLPVQAVDPGHVLRGYVHACRLPPTQAAAARRRLTAQAKKKGRPLSQRALALAAWVLIFTTVPPTVLPTATIAPLYRVRWQVELVIKRWKSILHIDHLRARQDSALAEVYLHGKLLYAWVLEQWAGRRRGDDGHCLDCPRRATPWRVWKLLRQELAVMVSGVGQWSLDRWAACLEVMQERPRRRSLQTLPARVSCLIAGGYSNGFSHKMTTSA